MFRLRDSSERQRASAEEELHEPSHEPAPPGKRTLIQRELAPGADASSRGWPGKRTLVQRALSRQGGVQLPRRERKQLERALGVELGGVRLHTGPDSDQAAGALGARAFAVGQAIHFAAGQFDPSTEAGRRLLAHEVAHAVQQPGTDVGAGDELAVSDPGDAHEREAEHFADAFMAGAPARLCPAPAQVASRALIYREPVPGATESVAPGADPATADAPGAQALAPSSAEPAAASSTAAHPGSAATPASPANDTTASATPAEPLATPDAVGPSPDREVGPAGAGAAGERAVHGEGASEGASAGGGESASVTPAPAVLEPAPAPAPPRRATQVTAPAAGSAGADSAAGQAIADAVVRQKNALASSLASRASALRTATQGQVAAVLSAGQQRHAEALRHIAARERVAVSMFTVARVQVSITAGIQVALIRQDAEDACRRIDEQAVLQASAVTTSAAAEAARMRQEAQNQGARIVQNAALVVPQIHALAQVAKDAIQEPNEGIHMAGENAIEHAKDDTRKKLISQAEKDEHKLDQAAVRGAANLGKGAAQLNREAQAKLPELQDGFRATAQTAASKVYEAAVAQLRMLLELETATRLAFADARRRAAGVLASAHQIAQQVDAQGREQLVHLEVTEAQLGAAFDQVGVDATARLAARRPRRRAAARFATVVVRELDRGGAEAVRAVEGVADAAVVGIASMAGNFDGVLGEQVAQMTSALDAAVAGMTEELLRVPAALLAEASLLRVLASTGYLGAMAQWMATTWPRIEEAKATWHDLAQQSVSSSIGYGDEATSKQTSLVAKLAPKFAEAGRRAIADAKRTRWERVRDRVVGEVKSFLVGMGKFVLVVLVVAVALFALGVAATFAAAAALALAIVGGLYLAYAFVTSLARRIEQLRSVWDQLSGPGKVLGVIAVIGVSVGDTLGLSQLAEAISGHELITNRELSEEERWGLATQGALMVITLGVGHAVGKWLNAKGGASGKGTPPGETPPGETPPGETPPGETPPGETPPGETPPENAPPENAPPENAPPENAPPENAPPENAPPENAPPENAPPENAPPENAPPENAPPENAPPENAPPEPSLPPDLAELRDGLSPKARQQLDRRLGKMARDPQNPTEAELARLRKYLDAKRERGGGDLERGLEAEYDADAAKANAEPRPHGAAAPELPELRARAKQVRARVDEARSRGVKVEGLDKALAGEEASLSKLESGANEATPARTQGVRSNLNGVEGELDVALSEPGVTGTNRQVTGNGEATEVDVVSREGRQWNEVKNKGPFGLESSDWTDPKHGLDVQSKRLNNVAADPANAVEGAPPKVVVHFPRGVTPEVKAALEARGIEVRGPVVEPPPPSGGGTPPQGGAPPAASPPANPPRTPGDQTPPAGGGPENPRGPVEPSDPRGRNGEPGPRSPTEPGQEPAPPGPRPPTTAADAPKVEVENGLYQARDPNTGELLGMGEVDANGYLELAIYTEAAQSPIRGGAVFNAVVEAARGNGPVKGVRGLWYDGDNLATLNREVAGGASPEVAAGRTFTGKMAERAGYPEVRIDYPRSPRNPDGSFQKAEVYFDKSPSARSP